MKNGKSQVTWHHDVFLEDGTPYPLRHRLEEGPKRGDISDRILGLTKEESRTSTAVHELGHAVVWLAGGLHVTRLAVDEGPGGAAESKMVHGAPQQQMARVVGIVAGERATDRWLREEGLWTPSLAAMTELSAAHDRALVFASNPHPRPGFGDSNEADYSELHDLADDALDTVWDKIRTALPLLVHQGAMTGEQLAASIGLQTPTVTSG